LRDDSNDPEARAVYLLVEIRKILDHAYDKKTDYALLRFYCDWIVHTEKTRSLEHIAPLVQKVYVGIKTQIEQGPYSLSERPPIVEFIYMDSLKEEMISLFEKEGLPKDLFEKDAWNNFVAAVVQVLVDQPILNPVPEVPCIVLTPSNPGCICGTMEFTQPVKAYDGQEYSHYNFKNVY